MRALNKSDPFSFNDLDRGVMPRRSHIGSPAPRPTPGKSASGDRLPMPAPARVFRKPVDHRLGSQPVPVIVAKQRLRGSPRLQRIFRTDAAGWPHRAAEPMCLRRKPPLSALLDQLDTSPLPRAPCRCWLAEDLGARCRGVERSEGTSAGRFPTSRKRASDRQYRHGASAAASRTPQHCSS
jgi:hypothetical protein